MINPACIRGSSLRDASAVRRVSQLRILLGSTLCCKASESVDTVNRKITDHRRRRCCSHPIGRRKTVSKLFLLEPLGLALSEKQIPQIVETIRSVENKKKLWKPPGCALGRCASRLRYAPTFYASHSKPLLGAEQRRLLVTVPKP